MYEAEKKNEKEKRFINKPYLFAMFKSSKSSKRSGEARYLIKKLYNSCYTVYKETVGLAAFINIGLSVLKNWELI